MNCNICQHTYFNIYARRLNIKIEYDEATNLFDTITGMEYSYIQCCQCHATVWGIESGWYPCLASDKERWRNRNLKPTLPTNEDNAKTRLLKSLTADDIKAILAMRGKV